jgi:hypothetical protein
MTAYGRMEVHILAFVSRFWMGWMATFAPRPLFRLGMLRWYPGGGSDPWSRLDSMDKERISSFLSVTGNFSLNFRWLSIGNLNVCLVDWSCIMTNVMYKLLIYLSFYSCITCFGLSFNPSSEADVQLRQWFKSLGYGVSARTLTPYPGHCRRSCTSAS